MRTTLLFLFFFFILLEKGHTFSEVEFKEQVESQVAAYIKQYNGAGLAIAVFKNSFGMEKPYQKTFCFGYSKRSQKTPIKDSTLFRIGSLSKTFLAVALMQCVEEKKLSMEDAVSKYLSKTFALPKHHEEDIKLMDLVMHTSGLPPIPTMPMKLYQVSEMDIENYFRKYKLPRAPGKKYEDSDLGYSLLGCILSRLEKVSYGTFLLEKILNPLGLNETFYSIPLSKMNHLATGYRGIAEVGDQFVDREGSFFKPSRALVSNINDLKKWLFFFLSEKPTSLEGSLKLIYNHFYIFPDNSLKKRAAGFCVEPLSFKKSLITYKEDGIYQGFSHAMAFVPDTRTGIVILSNTEYEVSSLATTLLELLNN